MFKPQMKFQKILSLSLLIFAAVCFVFSIGITTDLYGLYNASAVAVFDGIKIFKDIQTYNNNAVIFSIVLIGSCLLPFIFATNKRRLYYVDNYVTIGIQSGIFIGYGIYILINSIHYKNRFLTEVDFAEYKATAELFKFKYSESTFFFDAGIVLSILCFVMVLFIVGNLVWKIMIMNKEKQLLMSGEQND